MKHYKSIEVNLILFNLDTNLELNLLFKEMVITNIDDNS